LGRDLVALGSSGLTPLRRRAPRDTPLDGPLNTQTRQVQEQLDEYEAALSQLQEGSSLLWEVSSSSAGDLAHPEPVTHSSSMEGRIKRVMELIRLTQMRVAEVRRLLFTSAFLLVSNIQHLVFGTAILPALIFFYVYFPHSCMCIRHPSARTSPTHLFLLRAR